MTNGRNDRAVSYARKSNKQDTTEEQSASVADQLDRNRDYAERQGWQVVGEFSDDGRSGLLDRSKRPGLDAALTALASGDADKLIVYWKSRLSRDELDRAIILRDLERWNVEWHAVADGGLVDRTTYAGYVKDKADEMIDTSFSIRVKENWRKAHSDRIDAGLPKSRSHRFGYRWDASARAFVVHDAEAEAVRELYRRYIRGEGFSQLVRWINAEGWKVNRRVNGEDLRGEWSVRTLNRFMDNGFAAGLISQEKELRNLKGAHDPIISEQQWLAYRAEREKRAELGRKASGAGERWWLAGLVKCGECGGPTYVDSFKRRDGRGSVLCSNRRAKPGSCSGSSVLRSYVENAVALWLGSHLDQLDALASSEAKQVADAAATTYNEAVAARDRIADGLADLEVARSLRDIDATVYDRAKKKLDAQHALAEAAVMEAAAGLAAPEADTSLIRSAAAEGWTADHRAALRGVLDRVEVHDDVLTIVPISGQRIECPRSQLVPRCGVSGCDRVSYTKGLCKSHTMRTRKVSDELFDAVVLRVAEAESMPERRPTVEDVDRLLAESA
jgi:site-specific DNA recombinase